MSGAFDLVTKSDWTILWVALILVGLLIVSFRSRAYVFCQYLKTMTGIALRPSEVRRAFKSGASRTFCCVICSPMRGSAR